ncbi:Structural maintenance of chromosomes protein 6 [Spathaspora sp. JA1]|nr:Structural maintenance of chromosomes protein 6 [Spathaspora sp. JA1]
MTTEAPKRAATEEFDPSGQVSINDFVLHKLTKRRKMMTQTADDGSQSDRDSSENDSDESDDTNETEEDEEDLGTVAAQAGIIEKLTLRNFMCHDFFELKLGPQINFIIGRNGSGKSAILTGISVGLGAKASDTNRGQSIRELIKDGKSTARITIVLKNEGPEAFRASDFGKKIIIERKLVRSGVNSYSVKNEHGNVISNKKSMIDEILYKFSISIDNPLAFLSQDKAREFLTSSTDSAKYEFFIKGAHIGDILDNYTKTNENTKQIENKVTHAEAFYQDCNKKYKQASLIYNQHKKSDWLRKKLRILHGKIYWFNVKHIEDKVEKYNTRVTQFNQEIIDISEQIVKFNEEITKKTPQKTVLQQQNIQAESEYNQANNQLESIKQNRNSIKEDIKRDTEEIRNRLNDIDTCEEQIKTNQDLIVKEQQRIDAINGGSKDLLRQQLEEVEQQLSKYEIKQHELRDNIDELKDNPNTELAELTKQQKQTDTRIKDLISKQRTYKEPRFDQYGVWGNNMARIIHEINQIKTWHNKPIGPIGNHIIVKKEYQKWTSLLNTNLSKTLDSFLVSNEHDRAKLDHILKKYRVKNNIVVRKFHRFSFMQGKPEDVTTVLDVLHINNQDVLHSLVDVNNIEKMAVLENKRDLDHVLRTRNVTCVFMLFSKNSGQRVSMSNNTQRQDPIYYMDDIKFKLENSQDLVNQLTKQIDDERISLNQINHKIRDIRKTHQTKLTSLQDELTTLNKEIKKLKAQQRQIEIQLNENTDQSKIERLNAQIEDFKTQIQRYEGVNESMHEEINSKKEELNSIRTQIHEIRKQVELAIENKERIQQELISFEADLTTELDTIKHYEYERVKRQDLIKSTNEKLEQGNEKLLQLIQQAEEKCQREEVHFSVDDTHESIAAEYKEINEEIQQAEKSLGKTFDQVQLELEQTLAAKQAAQQELTDLTNTAKRLRDEMNIRIKCFTIATNSAISQANESFENSLSLRGFQGSLNIDFDAKTLSMLIKTNNKEDLKRNVESLSGGEKSFSQISLLLSIWRVMDSRIRGLDEFDVFMDSINRTISIKLLLHELKNYPKSQTIFITPQDITNIADLNNSMVKIHKMHDPR